MSLFSRSINVSFERARGHNTLYYEDRRVCGVPFQNGVQISGLVLLIYLEWKDFSPLFVFVG